MSDDRDDDDSSDVTPTDQDEADVVRRVLDERGLEAEDVLITLVRAVVARHVDVELRKRGRRPAYTPGNERMNALTAVLDALHESHARRVSAEQQQAREARGPDAPVPIHSARSSLPSDAGRTEEEQALWELFATSQFLAEHRAGMTDDDDDDGRPMMRLVTE